MGKDCCAGKQVCCPPKNAKAAAAKNSSSSTAAPSKATKKGAAVKHVEEEEEEDIEDFDEDDIIDGKDIDRADLAKMMVEGLKAKAAEKFEALPLPMKIKISALKKLQANYDDNRKTFQDEIFALEQKYAELNKPLFDKRSEIVSGKIAVAADDLKDEDKEKFSEDAAKDTEGIPEFWLTVLQNSEVADTILDYDIPALKYLTNIEAINHKKEYELLFHFAENEFFTNKVLKKSYVFEDSEEGAQEQPHCIVGTEIDWKTGKDLTVETVTLKPKAKKKGKAAKPITKIEPRASFFNFFKSVEFPDEEASDAEENMEEFNFEFELGDEIRERIIPMAVLYYTGEMVRMPDFNQFEDDEDDEDAEFDDDDFEEDDDSEEEAPKLIAPKKGAKAAKTASQKKENLESVFPQQKPGDQPPECKQQ